MCTEPTAGLRAADLDVERVGSGPPVVLVDIPRWDYNWQETYWLQEPIAAKAGTKLEVEAVFDNSADNPNNPSSPPRPVRIGEQTTSEMCFVFIGISTRSNNPFPLSPTGGLLPRGN